MTSDSDTGHLAGFREIWAETVRNVYGVLEETEVIRFTRPDGTAVWVTSVVVGILAVTGDVLDLTVYGVTEDGKHVKNEFSECADEYPGEVAPLISILVKGSEA